MLASGVRRMELESIEKGNGNEERVSLLKI
jgi:hypothetical protein